MSHVIPADTGFPVGTAEEESFLAVTHAWPAEPIGLSSSHVGDAADSRLPTLLCHRYSGWFCLETFGEELAGSHVPNLIDLIGWYA